MGVRAQSSQSTRPSLPLLLLTHLGEGTSLTLAQVEKGLLQIL